MGRVTVRKNKKWIKKQYEKELEKLGDNPNAPAYAEAALVQKGVSYEEAAQASGYASSGGEKLIVTPAPTDERGKTATDYQIAENIVQQSIATQQAPTKRQETILKSTYGEAEGSRVISEIKYYQRQASKPTDRNLVYTEEDVKTGNIILRGQTGQELFQQKLTGGSGLMGFASRQESKTTTKATEGKVITALKPTSFNIMLPTFGGKQGEITGTSYTAQGSKFETKSKPQDYILSGYLNTSWLAQREPAKKDEGITTKGVVNKIADITGARVFLTPPMAKGSKPIIDFGLRDYLGTAKKQDYIAAASTGAFIAGGIVFPRVALAAGGALYGAQAVKTIAKPTRENKEVFIASTAIIGGTAGVVGVKSYFSKTNIKLALPKEGTGLFKAGKRKTETSEMFYDNRLYSQKRTELKSIGFELQGKSQAGRPFTELGTISKSGTQQSMIYTTSRLGRPVAIRKTVTPEGAYSYKFLGQGGKVLKTYTGKGLPSVSPTFEFKEKQVLDVSTMGKARQENIFRYETYSSQKQGKQVITTNIGITGRESAKGYVSYTRSTKTTALDVVGKDLSVTRQLKTEAFIDQPMLRFTKGEETNLGKDILSISGRTIETEKASRIYVTQRITAPKKGSPLGTISIYETRIGKPTLSSKSWGKKAQITLGKQEVLISKPSVKPTSFLEAGYRTATTPKIGIKPMFILGTFTTTKPKTEYKPKVASISMFGTLGKTGIQSIQTPINKTSTSTISSVIQQPATKQRTATTQRSSLRSALTSISTGKGGINLTGGAFFTYGGKGKTTLDVPTFKFKMPSLTTGKKTKTKATKRGFKYKSTIGAAAFNIKGKEKKGSYRSGLTLRGL